MNPSGYLNPAALDKTNDSSKITSKVNHDSGFENIVQSSLYQMSTEKRKPKHYIRDRNAQNDYDLIRFKSHDFDSQASKTEEKPAGSSYGKDPTTQVSGGPTPRFVHPQDKYHSTTQ